MTGALSRHQAIVAVVGAFVGLTVLRQTSSSPLSLPAMCLAIGAFAVLTVKQYRGMPVADWAVKWVAFKTGEKAWRAQPVGREAEQLPRELAGVRVVSVRTQTGSVGMMEERDTLTAVSRLEVHSLGLFDESEQARRMEAFKRILDDLSHEPDDRYRVALLSKHVPRRANEELEYIHAHVVDADSPQARSMLEVVEDTQEASHEDQMYACVRLSRKDGARAAAKAIDRLTMLLDRLAQADIAVRMPVRLLEPRELARLIKDSYDPFGRALRDDLERVTGESGTDPAAAWPDATYRHVDCYEADGAFHATFWMRGWPQRPVGLGWMRPLTLRCDVPAMTIATVLKPEDPARAVKRTDAAQSWHEGARMFRRKHGQSDTVQHGRKAEFLARQAHQMANEDASPWWWETYVTVSAPDYGSLQRSARAVESACVECSLTPVPMWFVQAEAFTFSLPLGRGLEPERAHV